MISKVFKTSAADHGELLVMLTLANYANDEDVAWPAVSTICAMARLSERGARQCLRKLEKAGEIIPAGKGPKGTVKYRLHPGGAENAPGKNEHPGGAFCGPKNAPEPLTTVKEPSLSPADAGGDQKASVQDLVDLWSEAFQIQFGRLYKFNPSDFRAAKQLLKTGQTAGAIMRVATAAWARKGPRFFNCQQALTIQKLDRFWNEILRELDAIPEIHTPKPKPSGKPSHYLQPLPGDPDPDDPTKKLTLADIKARFPIENYDTGT